MAPRSGSRGDLPQFSHRAFQPSRSRATSAVRSAVPGFVAARPSFAAAACDPQPGASSSRARPTRSLAGLGARTLPIRPSSGGPSRESTADLPRVPPRRSRSPVDRHGRAPLPGLRRDAPGRLASEPAPMSLETATDRARALEDLTDSFYAVSSGPAVRARRTCYARLLSLWGVVPLPITVEKVLWLAAGLKARRYRSAPSVLSQLRVDAECQGQDISSGLRRAFTDAARACRRGLGPAITAKPLDFEALGALPLGPEPWHAHGPIGPAAAMVVGSWWLLRETEASNLRAAHVAFRNVRGALTVELLLPASKGDQESKGVRRAQACICRTSSRRPDCPAHAALRQMALLRHSFPSKFSAEGPLLELPFFPATHRAAFDQGRVCGNDPGSGQTSRTPGSDGGWH